MNTKNYIIFFLMAFSCTPKKEAKTNTYFDVKGFFETQIVDLQKTKPLFEKSITIDGKKEEKELSNINWSKELEPFVQADINKVANIGRYDILKKENFVKYTLKASEKAAIKSITVFNNPYSDKIEGIFVEENSENMLYNWTKNTKAYFVKEKLSSYSIDTSQKILIFDKKTFLIEGRRKI